MDKILQAEQTSRLKNYTYRLPDIAYTRARIQLFQGNVDEAAQLAQQNVMPLMQARVLIAQGNPSEALALVEPQRQQAEAKRLPQRLLLVMAVQSVVLFAHGEKDKAVQVLAEALALAEPGGYIRLFVDEGALMAQLLLEAASHGVMPDYVARLLAAFEGETKEERQTASVSRTVVFDRTVEPARVGNIEADRPGTLESRDRRAAVPGPGHGQRA